MKAASIVGSTGDAAFIVDANQRIIAWNAAAEDLFGYELKVVLGRSCAEVIGGFDVFGNRLCHEDCAVLRMAQCGEPVSHFEIDRRRPSGELVRVAISVVTIRGCRPSEIEIVHLAQPVGAWAIPEAGCERTEAPGNAPPLTGASPALQSWEALLTSREKDVLRLLAAGFGTREIGDSLHIGTATVRTHIQHVLEKLNANSRVQALAIANDKRLL